MFEAIQTHCGQYKRCGDFFREWEVKTKQNREETVEWCFSNLYKQRVPHSGEWHANIRYGAEKFSDAAYYFDGYYDIIPIDGGFKFVICEPYSD